MSNAETQSHVEKNLASQNSRHKRYALTRQQSEGTELAELLAEHQERQLRSMQGLNVGLHGKWGSSSRINELQVQTNTSHPCLTTIGLRHLEQIPLNNAATLISGSHGVGMSSQNSQQVMHTGKKYGRILTF